MNQKLLERRVRWTKSTELRQLLNELRAYHQEWALTNANPATPWQDPEFRFQLGSTAFSARNSRQLDTVANIFDDELLRRHG